MAPPTGHSDPAYKLLLSHSRVAADLIRLLGDDWVDDLDLDRLERLPAEMLAETLREWDERKFDEGRQEGRQEGRRAGRREVLEQERALLCSQAGRRFGAATGVELAALIASVDDGAELAQIGTLIVDCATGRDFLARARSR